MFLFALALVYDAQAQDQRVNDWIKDDMAARDIARDQASPLFAKTKAAWFNCLTIAAKRMSTSRDAPNFIATAAMAKCVEWENPLLIGIPYEIALTVTSMPFRDSLRIAEQQAPSYLTQMKANAREKLIGIVVESRTPKRRKR